MKLTAALALSAPLALGGAACAKDGSADKPAPEAKAEAQPAPAMPRFVAPVLLGYEQMRNELARDEIATAIASAKVLETAAKQAAGAGEERWRAPLEALAKAAAGVAETEAKDPNAVRKAYGEVSRHFVALLVADPSLQQGRFLYECPMAQGYPKWVQVEKRMANPYMGKRMLECGAASDWEV